MTEKKSLPGGAILLGIVLIAIGALVLLANLGKLPFAFDLHHWWPLILIVLGVVHLVNNRNIFDFSGLFRSCWAEFFYWLPWIELTGKISGATGRPC